MKKALLVATLSIVFLGFDARAFAERCGCVYCFESVTSGWGPQNDCCKQAEKFCSLDWYSSNLADIHTATMRNRGLDADEDHPEDEDDSETELDSESLEDLKDDLEGKTKSEVIALKGEPDEIVNGILFYETECHDPGAGKKYEKFVVIFGPNGKCFKIDGYDEI